MGKYHKVYKYKLEKEVENLHFIERKTYVEIADFLLKKHKLKISSESIRRWIKKQEKTR